MNHKPVAGELWLAPESEWPIFITHIVSSENGEWVLWDILDKQVAGQSSMEWFLKNCKKRYVLEE